MSGNLPSTVSDPDDNDEAPSPAGGGEMSPRKQPAIAGEKEKAAVAAKPEIVAGDPPSPDVGTTSSGERAEKGKMPVTSWLYEVYETGDESLVSGGEGVEVSAKNRKAAAPEIVAASPPPPPGSLAGGHGVRTRRTMHSAIDIDAAIASLTSHPNGEDDPESLDRGWRPGAVAVSGLGPDGGDDDERFNENADEGEGGRRGVLDRPISARVVPDGRIGWGAGETPPALLSPSAQLEPTVLTAETSLPLNNAPPPLVEGRRVDTASPSRRRPDHIIARRVVLVLAVFAVAAVAAAVGAALGVVMSRSATEEGSTPPLSIIEGSARYQAMGHVVIAGGVSSPEDLSDPASPQFRALTWLADEDARNIQAEDDAGTLIQRYLAALLYFAMGGEGWDNSTNYLTSRHECQWHGIGCRNDTDVVQHIALDNNNLNGTIPAEIFALKLDRLSLVRNKIGGTISNSICNLSSMNEIHLWQNSLSGSLPSCLGELENLNDLRIWENMLTGFIPESINDLKALRILDLSINFLSGPITIDFHQLSRELLTLVLYDNMMSGTIPSSVKYFGGTDFLLGGRGSNMSGTIPDDIGGGAESRLRVLGLWDMGDLTGTIPSDLFRMSDLAALALTGNELTGSLPPSLGETPLPHLRGIGLERNRLSGTVPASIGNITALEALNMHSNEFNGTLPAAMGALTSMKALVLSNNSFSGPVPDTFRNLGDLFYLSVTRNDLSGSLDFLCDDLSVSLLSADCKGDDAEVECSCCLQCCEDNDAGCNNYISSIALIKNCANQDKGADYDTLCSEVSW